MRVAILQALSESRNDRAFAALLSALRDPAEEVQTAAIHALKRFRDPAAIAPLVELWDRVSPAVQPRVAQALEYLGGQPPCPAQEIRFAMASGDLARAARQGPQAIGPLTHALNDPTYGQRVAAVALLGEINDAAVLKPLTAALTVLARCG